MGIGRRSNPPKHQGRESLLETFRPSRPRHDEPSTDEFPLITAAKSENPIAFWRTLNAPGGRKSINIQDAEGHTALYHAAINGHVSIVKQLLHAHADTAIEGDLHLFAAICIRYEHKRVQNPRNVEVVINILFKYTMPIIPEELEVLKMTCPRVKILNSSPLPAPLPIPEDWGSDNPRSDVEITRGMREISQSGGQLSDYEQKLAILSSAISSSTLELERRMAEAEIPLWEVNWRAQEMLYHACHPRSHPMPFYLGRILGEKSTITLLTQKISCVNWVDLKTGFTAITSVAKCDEIESLGRLIYLKGGASMIDHQDSHGRTALYYAAINGHLRSAMMLILRGAKLDQKDKNGLNVLEWICENYGLYEGAIKERIQATMCLFLTRNPYLLNPTDLNKRWPRTRAALPQNVLELVRPPMPYQADPGLSMGH